MILPTAFRDVLTSLLPNGSRRTSGRRENRRHESQRHRADFSVAILSEQSAAPAEGADLNRLLIPSERQALKWVRLTVPQHGVLEACGALGGIDTSAVAIGTDTRIGMLGQIGIPVRYVGETDASELESSVEHALRKRATEKERLLQLRKEVWNRYLEILRPVISPGA